MLRCELAAIVIHRMVKVAVNTSDGTDMLVGGTTDISMIYSGIFRRSTKNLSSIRGASARVAPELAPIKLHYNVTSSRDYCSCSASKEEKSA